MTAELPSGRALELNTLLWILIRVVSTVVLAVTLPAQGFTKGVVALELVQGAVSTHSSVTFLLIAAIQTVNISIAAPADGDAMAIFALELITVTLHITAILI